MMKGSFDSFFYEVCLSYFVSNDTEKLYILIAASYDEMHVFRLVTINLYFIPVMHVFIRINILGRVF